MANEMKPFSERVKNLIKDGAPAPEVKAEEKPAETAAPETKTETTPGAEGKPEEKPIEDKTKTEEKSEVEEKPSLFSSFAKNTKKTEEKPTDEKKPTPEESFRTLAKQKEDLEARLKAAEARVPADYETVKAQLAKMQEDHKLVVDKLKQYSVRETPEFQEKYEKRAASLVQGLQKSIAFTEADPKAFNALLFQPPGKERTKAMAEIISSFDELTKTRVATAVAEYDSLREEVDGVLAQPDQLLKLNAEKAEMARRQRVEEDHQLLEGVLKSADEYDFMKPTGNSEYDSEIKQIKDFARHLWTSPKVSQEERAKAMFAAASAPFLHKVLAASMAENEKLQATIAKLRGTAPKNGASTAPAPASAKSALKPFSQKVKELTGTA